MKARIIATDEWIEVQPWNNGFYDVETHDSYDTDELDFSTQFDWSAFRRDAAKDFISGMLANVSPAANQWTTPEIVSAALEIADELIKQLKQK